MKTICSRIQSKPSSGGTEEFDEAAGEEDAETDLLDPRMSDEREVATKT